MESAVSSSSQQSRSADPRTANTDRPASVVHEAATPHLPSLTRPGQDVSPDSETLTTPAQHRASSTPLVPSAVPVQAQAPIFSSEDDESLSVPQHMFAGGVAGMCEHMFMYPVDTVKTRLQAYVALRDFDGSGRILHAIRSIVSSEGIGALFRGIGAVALSAGPAHALYFATYEATRSVLAPTHRTDGRHHPFATAVAGVTSTFMADGVMAPLDVVKQRMQLAPVQTYPSVVRCMQRVYADHGVSAFFAGFRATILMNIPFTAVYFSGYESAKKIILDWRQLDERDFSASSHCVAGALAGGAAAAASNPLDLVKTRLQTQGEVGARKYKGFTDALRLIYVEEGWQGLMRGVRPRVVFHMPAAAVCWTTYEFCKHIMGRTGPVSTVVEKGNKKVP